MLQKVQHLVIDWEAATQVDVRREQSDTMLFMIYDYWKDQRIYLPAALSHAACSQYLPVFPPFSLYMLHLVFLFRIDA
jgi:hypothetical protein